MNDNDTGSAGDTTTRRGLLKKGGLAAGLAAVGGVTAAAGLRGRRDGYVWQIDPDVCIQCQNCATECVLEPSAVKCVHNTALCGYCDLCFGYFAPGFEPETGVEQPGAESQLCPVGAIGRKWIEGPHYEYSIDSDLCIGCAKCVVGCTNFGNGSLFLQVMHDRCLNCNECSIAASCPSGAVRRVPADRPYLLKGEDHPA